jgi:predicted MPP superfamily phosphohydrolase
LGYKLQIGLFHRLGRSFARVAGLGVGEIVLKDQSLVLPAWPAALAGLRVAVVADIHAGGPQVDRERLDEIVERVNEQQVDLVALLGDYIDPAVALGEWIEPETIAAKLAGMHARLGTVAVLGNHDWAHTGARMGSALRDAGITLLENDVVHVAADPTAAADGFWVAGLGDLDKRIADLDGTLAKVPDGEPVLLLSHNPDVFPRVPAHVALTLSGHTHGAQVDIPLIRDKTTPSRYGAHYTSGHIEEGGRHLYVSDGIGTSRFPIRFRAKPEIAVIELQAWTSDSPSSPSE